MTSSSRCAAVTRPRQCADRNITRHPSPSSSSYGNQHIHTSGMQGKCLLRRRQQAQFGKKRSRPDQPLRRRLWRLERRDVLQISVSYNRRWEYKRIFLHDDQYCREQKSNGCRVYVALDPQPCKRDVVTITRYTDRLAADSSYRRRVSYISSDPPSTTAVVEYFGTH